MSDTSDQTLCYSTFTTVSKDGQRGLSGVVATYTDDTGTWVKVTVNGVVRSYEQIAEPT